MAHLLHEHGPPLDPELSPQNSLNSALMDTTGDHQPPPSASAPPSGQAASRKRKKAVGDDGEAAPPAEPRRLRRSHEACSRCRSKKIKCDSKHPRCTACATAGTPCHQEDRHRQTIIPRGHTERIERQLIQCDALLKRHIPGFSLDNIDEILVSQGVTIESDPAIVSASFQFQPPSSPTAQRPGYPLRPDSAQKQAQQQQNAYSPTVPPNYPMGQPGYSGPPPPGYPPYNIMGQYPPQQALQQRPMSSGGHEVPGQDPQNHDMSNTQALAKSFGVSAAIVNDIKLVPRDHNDKEDLAVGSGGLSSGRDRDITESSAPRDLAKWVTISMRRRDSVASPSHVPSMHSSVAVWLPKDRSMVRQVLDVYFTRLNFHRPVYSRREFESTLDALYEGQNVQHDPGYICSLYLMLALGTLSELNHLGNQRNDNPHDHLVNPSNLKTMMPKDWPDHEEFFERALAVKPDLRVTLSSLQALILLHWYLYTERQGRSLWRLVGSLVRLGIELGLHHDPTLQHETFSEQECQLRIRLWGIVMMHDRGTSLLLGRPLAIAPFDSNTPRPSRGKKGQQPDFSEHFLLSHPIAEIQADIINSLYTPTRQSGDAVMRHATRIIKSMVEFRRQLPENYRYYFSGTDDWPVDRRSKLVQDITEDQGLTLLKIGIARMLLLRALFSSKELGYQQRHRALIDAIVTSHNIIIVHNQLIRFPDIAFFVSPIPLHIAAMVILYGHMSRCDRLTRQVALEDVWMALDMLPRFRWRWERKDLNGGHPLIAKLAEKVLDVNLHQVGPPSTPVLLSEEDWEPGVVSPTGASSVQAQSPMQSTPTQAAHVAYGAAPYGGQGASRSQPDTKFLEVDTSLFYPFFPEKSLQDQARAGATMQNGHGGQGVPHNGNGNGQPDYGRLLTSHVQHPSQAYGYQQSQDSFVLEEKDVPPAHHGAMWMNAPEQKFSMQPGFMHS